MSRTNGINLDLDAAKLANVGKYNAIQRNDPQFSVYAGEKGINGNQHFPEMLERDIVSTAKLDDPSYSRQNPTYHGRNPAWLSPNIHAFDHDVAADVIAANAKNFGSSEGIAANPDYFGSRESMSNPDLHERIAQKVFELRRNNKDWAFSIDEHDRGWQRAFLTMTRSKPWEILNWKP
jgi:hypothetical protein